MKRRTKLRGLGFRVIKKWECKAKKTWDPIPKKQTRTYNHTIFYDFKSYHDKTKKNEVTASLTHENAHVPTSVSAGDTLEREPTHICDPNSKELIRKFLEKLASRRKNPRTAVREEFIPEDIYLLTGKQRRAAVEWCDQVIYTELAEAVYLRAQPTVLRRQSLVSGHRANNR